MEAMKKNDFVEIEFTGKIKDTGDIFDTNVKSEMEKLNMKREVSPYIICIGYGMTIKGLDFDLIGKETGKSYSSEFKAEDAFGKRNPSMIKMVPMKIFTEQKIMPQRGMQLSLDGTVVKVVSVSGGRVLVDFNNPLAGKNVVYDYKIVRKIEDSSEKINALQDFFFKKRFEFEVKDDSVIVKAEKGMEKFIDVMLSPFENALGLKIKTDVDAKDSPKNTDSI